MSPTVKKQRSRRYNVVMFSCYRNIVPFRQRCRPVRSGQDRPCPSSVWRCGLPKISSGFQAYVALGKEREKHLTLPISFLARLASLTIQSAVDMGDFAHVSICSCLYS